MSVAPPSVSDTSTTPLTFVSSATPTDDDIVLLLTTAPDMLLAKRIAHVVVEEHLAACVHVSPAGVSMYMWQGNLEGGDEVALTLKTTRARCVSLADRVRSLHPYDIPELLVLPVLGGSPDYLQWVRNQVRHGLPEGGC
ncbi:MAG: divalent-cation tolerance protein CutA [Alcaligenaceae bacterium]|nr:divalent-cation tolerance protein CutA [Alcaligenaceae bacterium]